MIEPSKTVQRKNSTAGAWPSISILTLIARLDHLPAGEISISAATAD
jgi:hypothetical protein